VVILTVSDMAQDAINGWINKFLNGCLKWVIDVLKDAVSVVNTNVKQVDLYYGIFLGFATSLVVAVVLGRIIITMLKEADDSTDVTWANIVMDSVKSAVSIPIMVFFQGFILKAITIPLMTFCFSESGGLSLDTVTHASKVATSHGTGYGFGVPMLILAFFLVVLVVFFVKIGIFTANLIFFNLSIPLVAVSIASESFDYFSTWWKKLIYLNVTMIAQVMALSLMVASFGLLDKGWGFLALTIGFGAMIITPPTVLQDFWQTTGMSKSLAKSGMRQLAMLVRR
jgi:hypothetical protein